jgi:hypothetical protein
MSEEIEVFATKEQIKSFIESTLWKDMVRELVAWSEGFRREQDSIVDEAASTNPSTASVLLHMGDLNGRQKAVVYMIGLPEMLLEIKEEQKQSKQQDVNLEVSENE